MGASPVEPSTAPQVDAAPARAARHGLSRRTLLAGTATAAVGISVPAGLTALLRRGGDPMFDGATAWLNTAPLTAGDLRGKVVLVDFWTFTCINWIRTAPYLRAWSRAYRRHGLVIIGVHTPEFSFEHDLGRVRDATRERSIDYPVAVDNDYAIWRAFDNHYWPALYFLDKGGSVRYHHFGEGKYAESERILQRLLGVQRDLASVKGRGDEAEADWDTLRTPETYLGHGRGAGFASLAGATADESRSYDQPNGLSLNQWALGGAWTIGREKVVLDRAGGSISLRFHARDAHLVLSSEAVEPIPFRVLLDGRAPGPSHGVDVAADGSGLLRGGRMYQLVRAHDATRDHTLQITFSEPGAEAYVFTFG
jgi:thiol-disulfide isomerase/thioredoxin